MKKLMIALAAAAAITGAAKAVGSGVGYYTDFEALALQIGSAFDATLDDAGTGAGAKYWAIAQGADENYATVTNANFKDSAGAKEGSNTALAIDTSARLSRQVNPGSEGAESFASTSLYFDGYVQFTAADSLPTTEAGDKLVVWLYGGDEDTDDAVAAALGLENKATTNLVITAATLDGNNDPTPTNFVVSGVSVLPDQWKRLTIKAFVEDNLPKFKVYIDGTQVSSGDTSVFNSLVKAGQSGATTLTSVSFEGTGAVDDLGFTAADLFPEAQPFDYAVTISDEDDTGATATYAVDGTSVSLVNGVLKVNPSATTVTFVVAVADGYKLANDGATKGAYDSVAETYAWTLNVAVSSLEKDGSDAITLSVVEDGAATTYELTLTAGEGTTLTAKKTSDNSPINTGSYIEEDTQVTITVTLGNDYENLKVTVGDADVTSQLDNGTYTFTMVANIAVETSATKKEEPAENWPTGDDLDALANQTVATAYPALAESALASVDAKVFATWAAGNGGVAFADKATTTYNVDCFLLNIANASTTEQIAAAKETAAEAIKITAITFDEDGKPVLTAPATYGNGKVVIKGSATLPVESWHDQIDGDHFFRSELVVDAVPEN